jgi:multiple sugar transport system ATP-binding protein
MGTFRNAKEGAWPVAALSLSHLSKTYPGGIAAVADLSLDVRDGELLVLLGPSACGKTTTLRLIAGLERPSSGTVAIDGRTVNDLAARHRDVAMVFQSSALYPHLTVRGNLAFALRLRHESSAEIAHRVRETAELLGIGELLERRPDQLSGGQRQRVALGRAIVRRPKLFLLDEPLSNLDAPLRSQMRREIARLHAQLGVTTVYVTHDQTEAMTLGHRVAVLHEGRLQQVAAAATLYDQPANRIVAALLGSPPMSLIDGLVEPRDGRLQFCRGDFRLAVSERYRAALLPHVGQVLTLGIRPEHVRLAEPNDASTKEEQCPAIQIPAVVELVEAMGGECHVHLHAAGWHFTARTDAGAPFHAGQKVSAVLAAATLHFFEPNGQVVPLDCTGT